MDNLSQEDIHAILDDAAEESPGVATATSDEDVDSVDATEGPADLVEAHDFNRPFNLSRNFERTLRGVCENFSKTSTLAFSNLVRANCAFSFGGVSLSSFGEAFAGVENPSCIIICSMPPLKGPVLLSVDAGLMYSLFTKLLGGPLEETTQLRDFTEIEHGMARRIVDEILGHFRTAAEKVVALQPEIVRIENNPSYLNVLSETETVLSLQYSIGIENIDGGMTFYLPLAAFEPVRDLFDPKEAGGVSAGGDPRVRSQVSQFLHDTPVHVSARLCTREHPCEELVALKIDDVLPVGHPVNRPVEVLVEGRPMFEATVGKVGESRALRILSRKEES